MTDSGRVAERSTVSQFRCFCDASCCSRLGVDSNEVSSVPSFTVSQPGFGKLWGGGVRQVARERENEGLRQQGSKGARRLTSRCFAQCPPLFR